MTDGVKSDWGASNRVGRSLQAYFKGSQVMFVPVLALIVLNLCDSLLTRFLVNNKFAIEGNPLLKDIVGGGWFPIIKIAGVLLAGLILWDIYRRHPRLALFAMGCALSGYALIVMWNGALYLMSS
jgi:hypothetical protein